MRRRDFLLAAAILAHPLRSARAQAVDKRRIAVVSPSGKVAEMKIGENNPFGELLSELKQLGYVEGENLIVDRYWGDGNQERYTELALEVIAAQPEVIFSQGTPMTLRFKRNTTTIPIHPLTHLPLRFGVHTYL